MNNRAYSLLEIKSIDAEQRVIEGIASTPSPDRSGDVMEPKGAQFTLPMPLKFEHKLPIGEVFAATVKADGIHIKARISTVDEGAPQALKDRLAEAWHSIKADPPLARGLSIGWSVLKAEPIAGTKFTRYLKWIWGETSVVNIPMNTDATILTVKSLDMAASGLHTPRATGLPVVHAVKTAPAMTIQEQITQFENTRAAKAAARDALMTKAAETGTTLDAAQTEEYDGLDLEIKSVDAHLVRLRDLEKSNIAAATKITPVTDTKAAGELRGGTSVVSVKSMLPKGTGFTRYAMALAAGKGDMYRALEHAKQWKDSTPEVELMIKAATNAGTTVDATWAGPLVPALQLLTSEFLELLRPRTVLGKIPGMRRVPFNVKVAAQTGGGTYGWVGEGLAKPVSQLAFTAVTLTMAKIAGIIVLTEELVRVSSPSAEAAVQADMIAGIAQFMDTQFTDPSVAAVATVNPASITNGTTPIASAGTSSANALTDVKALIAAFVGANLSLGSAVLLMSETNAFALATALNALGQPLFPSMTILGGSILGIPVITSSAIGSNIILVDANGILYADDGGVTLDVSREASLQMDSAPITPSVATTVLVNLWQNNLVGLRAERFCNWTRARLASVKYVSGAAYV